MSAAPQAPTSTDSSTTTTTHRQNTRETPAQ
jgi:hypothetical protein